LAALSQIVRANLVAFLFPCKIGKEKLSFCPNLTSTMVENKIFVGKINSSLILLCRQARASAVLSVVVDSSDSFLFLEKPFYT